MTETEPTEDDNGWLMGSLLFGGVLDSDHDTDDDDDSTTKNLPQHEEAGFHEEGVMGNDDLSAVMKRLGRALSARDDEGSMDFYINLVQVQMGSMALCRGARGEMLREAGAIGALLLILDKLKCRLPYIRPDADESTPPTTQEYIIAMEPEALDMKALELAIACMGALRDLCCGSALNRSAVRDFVCSDDNDEDGKTSGLALLALYLERYHGCTWDCVVSSSSSALDLRLLSSTIGVLRNVTHSSRENCLELHQCRVSSMLVWRLLQADQNNIGDATVVGSSYLPDAGKPWREAAYRAAGTLINLSEKCQDCALMCASDPLLIGVLVEAWGGTTSQKKTPLLHLGLAAILRAAEKELLPHGIFDESWHAILLKEQERKRIAQRREEERKQRL